MRIIAGEKRGLKLQTLPGEHTRPTADKVKEAVFSSLGQTLQDAQVLDLFAGSGSIGLEALSRGAAHATFVEADQAAYAIVQKNISKAAYQARSTSLRQDGLQALTQFGQGNKTFDLIYLDPPYHSDLYGKALAQIAKGHLLAPNGVIVIESGKTAFLFEADGVFYIHKEKTYGTTKVVFLRHQAEEE